MASEELAPDAFVAESDRQQLVAWQIEDRPASVHFAQTKDGWHIALSRYRKNRPAAHDSENAAAPAVLLVPGLASNRLVFNLEPSVSLAGYLADCGFDVFCLDLRGHGRSEKKWRRWAFLTT